MNEHGEKQNGFAEVVAFCHMTCRYFDRFLLQEVDRNWRQACLFYLAPGLICEGYWQVNSRRLIFCIADPSRGSYLWLKTFLYDRSDTGEYGAPSRVGPRANYSSCPPPLLVGPSYAYLAAFSNSGSQIQSIRLSLAYIPSDMIT